MVLPNLFLDSHCDNNKYPLKIDSPANQHSPIKVTNLPFWHHIDVTEEGGAANRKFPGTRLPPFWSTEKLPRPDWPGFFLSRPSWPLIGWRMVGNQLLHCVYLPGLSVDRCPGRWNILSNRELALLLTVAYCDAQGVRFHMVMKKSW